MNSEDKNVTGGKITVSAAIKLTANWREYLAQSGQKFDIKAFFVPINDFKEIIAHNPEAEGIRTYIGLDDPTDPLSARLVLVPVIDGKDVVFTNESTSGGNTPSEDSDDDSNIYDFTTPCPPLCPVDSPLSK